MSRIKLKKVTNGAFKARYDNGKIIGHFEVQDDGYFAFYPHPVGAGFWTQGFMEEIVKAMKCLNKKWNDQVQKDVGEKKQ